MSESMRSVSHRSVALSGCDVDINIFIDIIFLAEIGIKIKIFRVDFLAPPHQKADKYSIRSHKQQLLAEHGRRF
jgi:hypothetical protein